MRNLSIFILILITFLLRAVVSHAHWEEVPEKNIWVIGSFEAYSTRLTILDIFFLKDDPRYGWACGHEGRTYRTTDGGETWEARKIFFMSDNQLEHIQFVNKDVGYVSGTTGMGSNSIFKSTDGGKSWNPALQSENGYIEDNIWGNYFINENVGVALAGNCEQQRFYRTSDGGETWKLFVTNERDVKLSDAVLLEPDGLGYASGSGRIFITTDGGRSWRVHWDLGRETIQDPYGNKIKSTSWQEDIAYYEGNILVPLSGGCSGGYGGGVKFIKPDGTINYYDFKIPFYGTFLMNETSGWVVGHNGSVYYTEDSGKSWELNNCGVEEDLLIDDIYMIDDTTGFVVGNKIYRYVSEWNLEFPEIVVAGNLCLSDSVKLSLKKPFDIIRWVNLETGDTVSNDRVYYATESGTYTAYVRDRRNCDTLRAGMAVSIEANSDLENEITLNPEGPYCEGEIVTISSLDIFDRYEWNTGSSDKDISVSETGTYIVTAYDHMGCKTIDTVEIYIEPNPKPELSIVGNFSLCDGEFTSLIADEGYNDYLWRRIDPKDGSDSIIGNQRILEINQAGKYYLITTTANGCNNFSDTVDADFEFIQNVLEISPEYLSEGVSADTVIYPNKKCFDIEIRNISESTDFLLADPFLFRNVEFSIPQSLLPLSIPAGHSANLTLCFAPRAIGERVDTLQISDYCDDYLISLIGIGEAIDYRGEPRCDVPLKFKTKGIQEELLITPPYPNPSYEIIDINYRGNDINQSSASLYSVLGNKIMDARQSDEFATSDSAIQWKKFTFNIENLQSGTYIVIVQVGLETKTFPVIVNK